MIMSHQVQHPLSFSTAGISGRPSQVLPPIDPATGHHPMLYGHYGPAGPLTSGPTTMTCRVDSRQAHLQSQVKQLAAQNATLKQALKRQAQSAEAEARGLREQLARAQEAARQNRSRPQRDAMTQCDPDAHERQNVESRRLCELRETVAHLREETERQKEQLEVSLLLRKQMEVEHLQMVDRMAAQHQREVERKQRKHDEKVIGLSDQLEEVVLRAAIDLNRQYRELKIKHRLELRQKAMPDRRRTDGGHPFITEDEASHSSADVSAETALIGPRLSSRRRSEHDLPREPCEMMAPPSVRSCELAATSSNSPGVSAWSPDEICGSCSADPKAGETAVTPRQTKAT